MIRATTLGILLLLSFVVFSQKTKREYYFAQTRAFYGTPVVYSDSLTTEELSRKFFGNDFRLGVQANGERVKDQYLGFQQYGFGIMRLNMRNDIIGNPWATYAFFNAPIIRKGKFQLDYDVAFGVAWNFHKFDYKTNPRNDLVGSDITVVFTVGTKAVYRISDRFMLDIGAELIHFSNGKIQTPNKGMNLYAAHIGLGYYFQRKTNKQYWQAEILKKKNPEFKKNNEITLTYSISGKATNETYGLGPRYFVSSFNIDFYRRYGEIGKFGGGIDYIYDLSLMEDFNTPQPLNRFMFIGLHISHELLVSKISFITHIGTYAHKGMEAKGNFYFRVGMKYYATKNIYANITLKTANGFKADFIEFGMGYRIGLNKK